MRLWFYFFLMYGIGLIYLTWQVSVPVILVLGGLLASLRRNRTS